MLHDHITNTCDDATAKKIRLLAENADIPHETSLVNAAELQENNIAEANLLIRLSQSRDQSGHSPTNSAGTWYERIDHPLSEF